jgi:RimJ/RimL family protein N-acetyltransferase
MSQFDLPRPMPPRTPMEGGLVRLEPLSVASHAAPLFDAFAEDAAGAMWRYREFGPFTTLAAFEAYLERASAGLGGLHFAIVEQASGLALGSAAYLAITPEHGSVEVGAISFSPRLQRTTAATEAMYLMARRAFDELGYRRYEWKCNHANEASRAAALRLGFRYEGLFRNHRVEKGRNRDTAWFSIIDSEWPTVRRALQAWLDPGNFDESGRQRRTLAEIRAAIGPDAASG